MERKGLFGVVSHTGISPWAALGAGGVRHPGTPAVAVPGGCLDVCPGTSSSVCYSPVRFAARGSGPACHVSVENSGALLQTLGTCLDLPGNRGVSASPTLRAGRLSSAGLLATTDQLLGAGPGHPPALQSPGCGGGQRSCWCGHPVLARPSRCQVGSRTGQGSGALRACSAPWSAALAWEKWRHGQGAGLVEWVTEGLPWGCSCCRATENLPLVPKLGGEGSQTPPSSLSPQDAIYQVSMPMFRKTKSNRDQMHHTWSFGRSGTSIPCFAVPLCWTPPW